MWLSRTAEGGLTAEDNYFLDPGHPAAAQYVVDVALNLVRRYDIDGIHLDYIRYGGGQFGYNPVSVSRYMTQTHATAAPAATDPAWQQWRRDQVSHLMRQVYLEAITLKPQIKVSAATIAWGAGPTSDAEWRQSRTMNDTFQDWLGWLDEGILDMALPMNYDREANESQRRWFDQWIEWERDHRGDRHLVIGIGAYLNDMDANLAQIRRALAPSVKGNLAQGVCLYAYADADARGLSFEKLARALTTAEPGGPAPLFGQAAGTPAMPWKSQPTAGYLKGFVRYADGRPGDGLTVRLAGPVNRDLSRRGKRLLRRCEAAAGQLHGHSPGGRPRPDPNRSTGRGGQGGDGRDCRTLKMRYAPRR